ncbi:thioredoxin TrxA [Advenella alkanexedens]|jgi:thioredoxin 1|uniref:Thioredoxin n=1 Tax=Advenella alkanexedens TaxID=1481665 RepID=A0ABS6NRH1_9BURK|nr:MULTISPECIES: thioredoxin TrxA [Advenella]MBV4398233.1 thioredoxin TrxA [Advenella alkanexedens]MDD3758937.1 thioredoxin TrxA [Advenella sp.]NLN67091.1 thioredoxin TrxA [Alcaligenaceae bacterium]
MSDTIKHATESSFNADVLKSDKPVLVDYWAPWCGPCKAIAPVLEEVAKEYEGRLQVVKVDVQDHPEVAAQFGIRGIPTLMVFKNGEAVATKVGAVNKAQLTSFIDSAI